MKKVPLVAMLLVVAALAAPAATQARTAGEDGLRVRLVPPVNFAPTADCPTGAAIYGISAQGKPGTGTNCILGEVVVPCPAGVTAQFCQDVPVRMTLSLRGGTITGDVHLFEAWNCAVNCAVDQRWSGTVTSATGKFHKLRQGSVSGGGIFVFDATTFALVSLDETLVITRSGNNDQSGAGGSNDDNT
jgi:hypothetical protein